MKRLPIIVWAITWALCSWAEPLSDTLRLDCGKQVQITASPRPGYRFVRWSDGVKDNPRMITLSQDSLVTAIFAPECIDPAVPVQGLFGNLLVLDRPAFAQMGYNPTENEVSWFHIVGKIDLPDDLVQDDEPVTTGYYLLIDPLQQRLSEYYCKVRVTSPPAGTYLCYDYLRSLPWIETGTEEVEASDPWDNTLPLYNILGQPVDATYRGIIVQRGRKRLRID